MGAFLGVDLFLDFWDPGGLEKGYDFCILILIILELGLPPFLWVSLLGKIIWCLGFEFWSSGYRSEALDWFDFVGF